MKTIFKVFLIGTITTIFRIIGQLLIPAGSQNVLLPSIFVKNGTMSLAFSIYGACHLENIKLNCLGELYGGWIFIYHCRLNMYIFTKN